MKKTPHTYTLLGFLLALAVLASVGCLKTFTQDVKDTEAYDVARYSNDMVVQPGSLPTPLDEAEPGTYAQNQIVKAGDPIPLSHLLTVLESAKTEAEQKELEQTIKSNPPEVSQETRTIDRMVTTPELDLLIQGAQTFGGPWGIAIGGLIATGFSLFKGFKNKQRAIRAESGWTEEQRQKELMRLIASSSFKAIDGVRNQAKLIPDKRIADQVDQGLKEALKAAHNAAGVADEVSKILKEVETPYVEPLVKLD